MSSLLLVNLMALRPCRTRVKASRAPRACRAYQQRTVDVVKRAVGSWRAISGLEPPPFLWGGGSCSELARFVKSFLAKEVSSDPSLQLGFQSVKKLLPDSCRCMESGLLDNLVSRLGAPPRSLPAGYLSFVRREVSRLFPKGWDSSYERHCLTATPPLASCCEAGRLQGGALSVLRDQSWYLDRVLHGKGSTLCPRYAGKLMVVQSAGKPRPLSKFPAEALFLRPLHKTIYGNLSRRAWLLRGPPSREALASAGFVSGGGVLVSGDYRSATDNLPIEVMEEALKVMLRNAVHVPGNVAELALRACRPILFSEKESLEVTVGQMMGSYLSFPFLCLQNYLAFRWAVSSSGQRGRVPVLINGDDILFQTSEASFPEHWFKVVSEVGLEVEETKTSVEQSWGTLNSTLLRWEGSSLCPVWSPRFGMLRPADHPGNLGSSFLSFLNGAPSEYRFRSGRVWFEWHCGELRSAAVSLPTLGFRGLLAYRLARLFHLHYDTESEFPRSALLHGVGFSGDFVSRVPISAVDEELRFSSAVEIAACMWTEGWSPVSRVSSSIQYCLERSSVKGDRFDYPNLDPFSYMFCSDQEFRFRCRNLRVEVRRSRRRALKSFLAPFPVVDECLLATSVVESLLFDFGRGFLPPYSLLPLPGEFVEESPGRFVCCG
nr:MAG: putative RNA-dependent RNA polymerase [Botourmiaviridae sp.]